MGIYLLLFCGWAVIFVSQILFHDFGHALTALSFGQRGVDRADGTGGLTIRQGPSLSLFREFMVVLNGLWAGFLLAGITMLWLNS